ncbi:MAG: hypothetical protein ACM3KM_00480 [Acidobacteriaceae bacterium]
MAKSAKKGVEIGLGLAALAAATAGAYYFYSKSGEKHRKQLKSWMVKAKAEVMEKLEKATDLSKDAYEQIVDDVLKHYKVMKKAAPKEIADLARELKTHWKSIKVEVEKAAKKAKK